MPTPAKADEFSIRNVVRAAANGRLYVNERGMNILRLGRYDSRSPNVRAQTAAVNTAVERGWIVLDPTDRLYKSTTAGDAAVAVDRSAK